jgi:hypothetical protein
MPARRAPIRAHATPRIFSRHVAAPLWIDRPARSGMVRHVIAAAVEIAAMAGIDDISYNLGTNAAIGASAARGRTRE